MDLKKITTLAEANPSVTLAVLNALTAELQDPKVLGDALHVVDGSRTMLAFAQAHPGVVAKLVGPLLEHPDLLGQLLSAVE